MSDNNPTNLILRHMSMHHKREANEHPRQKRGAEHDQSQEAKPGIRVSSAPDVHERAGQCVTQKGHGEERRDAEEAGGCVGEQPCIVGWGAAGGLLEEAGVALHEEDVEEEVEA